MALTVSVDQIVQGSRSPLLAVRPHWKRIRLHEVASVLNGFAFKSTQFTKGEGMPLIRIRDVGSDSTDTNYVGEFDARYTVEPGDLLVGMDGDFNCARWRGPRGLLNQRVCKVSLHTNEYHPRFLDFALPGYLKAINQATSSVTVKHLSSRTVEDIPLPFPPLPEQEAIVAELEKQFSRLDEAVANLKRVKANLTRFKAAVLKAAVEGRLIPTEAEVARREQRSYEPGDALVQQILEARRRKWAGKGKYKEPAAIGLPKLPTLPEGWTWTSLDSLSWDSGYGTSAKCTRDNGGVPVLRIPNVQSGAIDLSDLKFAPPDFPLSPEERVSQGDMLIIRTNGSKALIGRAAIVTDMPAMPLAFASYLIRFRLCGGGQITHWVNTVWAESRLRAWIESHAATSAGQYNISQSVLATAAVPVPPLAEQRRIVTEVEQILSLVDALEREAERALLQSSAMASAVLSKTFG